MVNESADPARPDLTSQADGDEAKSVTRSSSMAQFTKRPVIDGQSNRRWEGSEKWYEVGYLEDGTTICANQAGLAYDEEGDEEFIPRGGISTGARILNEAAALHYLYKEHPKIPTPRNALVQWDVRGMPCIQCDYVEGRRMSELGPEDGEDLREVVEQIDGFVAELREDVSQEVKSFVGACQSFYSPDLVKRLRATDEYDDEWLDRLDASMALRVKTWSEDVSVCFSPPLSMMADEPWRLAYKNHRLPTERTFPLCHGDLTRANIVLHPTEAKVRAIIDWEYAGYYPVEADAEWYRGAKYYGPVDDYVRPRVDAAEAAYAKLRDLVPSSTIPEYKPARCNGDPPIEGTSVAGEIDA